MLNYDCRYFYGDKPCRFHKEEGKKCDLCDEYNPVTFKILIIKLDAIGDVLRTTSVLPPLKVKYPESHITWCTRENARNIFFNNKLVDDIITVEEDAFFRIMGEKYDIAINLDTSKFSSAIAASSMANKKIGFVLNEKGNVIPTSTEANNWLLMSAFDDVKKLNKKSYQRLMYEILDIDSDIEPPIIYSSEKIRHDKIKIFKKLGFDKDKLTIGINIGVGSKWPNKGWPIQNWEMMIRKMQKDNYNILLLGGNDEKADMELVAKNFPFVIETGSNNNIHEFSAIIDLCNVIITADTFALHIATALRKNIIALFGPTSMDEVYLYEKGIKIRSEEECKCYYNRNCSENISCMQKINAEQVYSALNSIINKM